MSDIDSDFEEKPVLGKEKSKKKDENENENENEVDEDDSGSESGSESGNDTEASDEDEDEDVDFDEDADIFAEETAGTKKKTTSKKPDVKPNNDVLINTIFGNYEAEADDEGEYGDVDMDANVDDEEEAYDEEEYGFKYLQKFDNDTRKQIIDEYHREALQHSYEEIDAMCRVVRTQDGIIDALHRTPPFLTKYEKARILGERAKQLGAGATPFIELEDGLIDEYTIAVLELQQGKLPFIIKRPLPNGGCEYWKLADLEIL